MRTCERMSFWLGAVVLACAALPAGATILTFQANATSLALMPQSYGDFVNGSLDGNGHFYQMGSNGWTPNVGLTYSNTGSQDPNLNGIKYYNDAEWPRVAYLHENSPQPFFDFTFTPQAGYGVRVNSFDLDAYAPTTGHTVNWTLYRTSPIPLNLIVSGTAAGFSGTVPVTTGMSLFENVPVILRIFHAAGNLDNMSVDNIDFQQTVPEPSGLMAVGVGLTLLGMRRKSRSSFPARDH